MRRFNFAVLLLPLIAAACSSGERPPDTGPDAPLIGGKPPIEQVGDDKDSQALLDQYAKRFNEGYPLYPGDVIKFSVLGNPDLSFAARVPSEGFITYPLIGKVVLVGRTTNEIREEVQKRLGEDFLVNPDVTVLIDEYGKKKVYILGSVAHPQDYELSNNRMITLLQAIAQAGGFTEDAEKNQVLIFRARSVGAQDRITLPVNVTRLTAPGLGRDPLVIPDDIIFVPAREKIYVLGQVQRPGAFTVSADQPTTVTAAISLAGGLTRISSEGSVRLIRKQKDGSSAAYLVNVARVLGGHPEDDAIVQPGDIIFVPESFF